jgi:hypothetical protein
MTEPEHPSFKQRRREADEAVRRRNLRDRADGNVVPLRRPKPKREFRLPSMPNHPAVLWAGIVAILLVVYLVQRLL